MDLVWHVLIAQSSSCLIMNWSLGHYKKNVEESNSRSTKRCFSGNAMIFKAAASHLQSKLPLQNELLRQLGCLNPLKKVKKSTLISIQGISSVLQPKINAGIIVDFGKNMHLKKAPKEKMHIFSKRMHPFCKNKKQKKQHFWSRKRHFVNIILLTKRKKKVLTIKLFGFFFICMIKFLRTRCKYK